MSKAKIDRKAAMRSSLAQEQKSVEDRFSVANKVLKQRPHGLANPIAPSFSAETETLPRNSEEVISVPILAVHDNPFNARVIYHEEVIKNLSSSIIKEGQIVACPAILHPDRPGEYVMIDGQYRKKSLIAAKQTHIKINIRRDLGYNDLYRISFLLNEERSAQTVLDNAFAWQNLLEKKIVSEADQIAEMIGVSKGTVSKTLAMIKLPEKVLEKIREHPDKVGVAIGYEVCLLAKKISEKELINIVDNIIKDGLSSREVEAYRKKLEEGKPRKTKEMGRHHKIFTDGVQTGVIREFDSGRVSCDVQIADQNQRMTFLDELLKRFNLKKEQANAES